MARRVANIDSDHMLVVIKLRARIFRAELQSVQEAQPLNLDEKCKKLEQTIQRVARKRANKEWLGEQCAKVKITPSESEPSKSKPEEPRMLRSL
jgi:hypothetical protein